MLADSSLRRAVRGIALERQGLAPVIVFSGGLGGGTVSEAEVRAALARDLGVPADHILTDTEARTTREEAIRLPRLLSSIGARRILLVTDPQHMARAMALFQRAGLEVLPAPAEDPERSADLARAVLSEWLARLYYRLAGYL